jgi:hypothetical protein
MLQQQRKPDRSARKPRSLKLKLRGGPPCRPSLDSFEFQGVQHKFAVGKGQSGIQGWVNLQLGRGQSSV